GVALFVAFGLAYLVRFETGLPLLEQLPYRRAFYEGVAFWGVPLWVGIFALCRLYDPRHLFAGFQEYARVLNACTAGTLAIVCASFIYVDLIISRGWLLLTWLLSGLAVCALRFAVRRVVRQLHRRGLFVTPTLIVGTNEEGRALAEHLAEDPG